MNPNFKVPADYFYALFADEGAASADSAFESATLFDEESVRTRLSDAVAAGTIAAAPGGVNVEQALRRLGALGRGTDTTLPECAVVVATPIANLVASWLAFSGADIASFWIGANAASHLDLVLCGITESHAPLVTAIKTELGVTSVTALESITTPQWDGLVLPVGQAPRLDLLPPYTGTGLPKQRVAVLVAHLRRFLAVADEPVATPTPVLAPAPRLNWADPGKLALFVSSYSTHAGAAYTFGSGLSETPLAQALTDVFPSDSVARAWLEQAVRTLDDLLAITDVGVDDKIQFSLFEALYARGFTDSAAVAALDEETFERALAGTVAKQHADAIHALAAAGGGGAPAPNPPAGFVPINDGSLVNCVPPPHLSPLGPVAYLAEMLAELGASASPIDDRFGRIADLDVTRTNLETPIPVIDLVNERLERMVANFVAPGSALPLDAIYNTATDTLGGHVLCPVGTDPDSAVAATCHDPATLFAALPEHSTPATPVKEPEAYATLATAFSAPALPYDQPRDIRDTYLGFLRVRRYELLRAFRRDITEFVLAPDIAPGAPGEFRAHLWRFPVRADIALDYLGITPSEAERLFSGAISEPELREIYGYQNAGWEDEAVELPQFLARTGLSYCEFLALRRSGFFAFPPPPDDFADCEPCDLTGVTVEFAAPLTARDGLTAIAVFLRLKRQLDTVSGGGYSFEELADIAAVLKLFSSGTTSNPQFLRQLATFQMLRDTFGLVLTDTSDTATPTNPAERAHLLALWAGSASRKWSWALDHLLDAVCAATAAGPGRSPEFVKLLADNIDRLSELCGFDPGTPAKTWHALPSHTLRFAEILAKLCASDFQIGEILLMCSADEHLRGDDPFALQSGNEALDAPLDLPDDDPRFALGELRKKLLAIEVSAEGAGAWSWARIEASLRDEFGYPVGTGDDALLSLGRHFFPGLLEAAGTTVTPMLRQYRVMLPGSPAAMWNTPPDGPFRYDATAGELWTQVPLSDEAVLAKLGRIRQLTAPERQAVRKLYFLPRVDLVPFTALFPSLAEAEARLIQEPDEAKRWTYFQSRFALFHARCTAIAEHLAGHVQAVSGRKADGLSAVAWQILKSLLGDENAATATWEDDGGHGPSVTWDRPVGSAFAAILGLSGTGLIGELMPVDADHPLSWVDDTLVWADDKLAWREVRGGIAAFGAAPNVANSPVPTVLPAMDLALSPDQLRFAAVRNGFARSNPEGAPLGGAQGFAARWRGRLLIETAGAYVFSAGAPAAEGVEPDYDATSAQQWRIILKKGQRTWVLLAHHWPNVHAASAASDPLPLQVGVYDISIELVQPAPRFDRADEVCPRATGFEVKYRGPDTQEQPTVLPLDKLFRDRKSGTLSAGLGPLDAVPKSYLDLQYTSTLRDIRRTYQRAFIGLLVAHRFDLSAEPVSDDGQSEIGYLLAHATEFSGHSFFPSGGGYAIHKAEFDLNFLPLRDNYYAPSSGADQRTAPSRKREQAVFDWWERLYDYAALRKTASTAPERPVWLLFHEAAEGHPDDPAQLLRHLGIDLRHAGAVLSYFVPSPGPSPFQVTSESLLAEPWAIRAWHADRWMGALGQFQVRDIRAARPDLWAGDTPDNENLTKFIRDGLIEQGEPRRYAELKALNDGLRERARLALLAYLTALDRVALPWDGFASRPSELTELLLIDVEADLCQRESRIDSAIAAVQAFVQRARLGLEPDFSPTEAFGDRWDELFVSFDVWRRAERRELYPEDYVEWDELEKSRQSEAFRFLEDGLQKNQLPAGPPGKIPYEPREPAPNQQGRTVQQAQEATLWNQLSALDAKAFPPLPGLVEEAADLETQYLRVAAAGLPSATTGLKPRGVATVPPVGDEYYFWLVDDSYYKERKVSSAWGVDPDGDTTSDWERPEKLPAVHHWPPTPTAVLSWIRIQDGAFKEAGHSHEGVRVASGTTPALVFAGRDGDSLKFSVTNGEAPVGYDEGSSPGFRFDLAKGTAARLPLLVTPPPHNASGPGGLAAYPFDVHFSAGAPLAPITLFSPALLVAGSLRSHSRYDDAIQWYRSFFDPFANDLSWQPPDMLLAGGGGSSSENRSATLHYIETLLDWADSLMRCGSRQALTQAREALHAAARLLGKTPRTVLDVDTVDPPQQVGGFNPHPAPLSPRLMMLYGLLEDRLATLHDCFEVTQTTAHSCPGEEGWFRPSSCYRFTFLIQKADQIAGEVRQLGASLLSALEKYDAEVLGQMRARHENQIFSMQIAVRQRQIEEANFNLEALRYTLLGAQTRLLYYQTLLALGLIAGERTFLSKTRSQIPKSISAMVAENISTFIAQFPDLNIGWVSFAHIFSGTKIAETFRTFATIQRTRAQIDALNATIASTLAGWVRRADEWRHQTEVIAIEILQIGEQIKAAETRVTIAELELGITQQQVRNSQEVWDFLRNKFTNDQLYDWMAGQLQVLHRTMFDMALEYARTAERAFNYELGLSGRKFVQGEIWSDSHKGLLSGERLQLIIRQMDKAYIEENCREYEVTKHVSLRSHFPREFLRLKLTGECEIEVPEWMFDLDYPGHYMRRLKNVSITIPCVVGPYSGVHCRLTLVSSRTRFDQHVGQPPAGPRPGGSADSCCDGVARNGYEALPDDPRFVSLYAATSAIATSSGRNDSGMFELNFRDERYLPFEFSGAISRWRIELPQENNQFDLDTLSDLVLHLNFMAREGGRALRKAANEVAQRHLPGAGWRLFDVEHEMPDAWHALGADDPRKLELRLRRDMFPFLPGRKPLFVRPLYILVELPDSSAGSLLVEYSPDPKRFEGAENPEHLCKPQGISFLTSAEWPGFYLGAIAEELGPIAGSKEFAVGTLTFPKGVGDVARIFLLCDYEVR